MVVSAEIAGRTGPRSATSVATPGLREPLLAWCLYALLVVLTFVTAARISAEELYRVDRDGLDGGFSRVLVELNFPVAIAAIPILGLCAARLRRPAASALAAGGVLLCASVAELYDRSDLDARPANAVPALGVAVAVALTAWALRDGGIGARVGRLPGDLLRIAIAAVTVLFSIPWLFAEAGFYAPDPIMSDELGREGDEILAAVHLGSHHGTEGAVLLLTALLLSRAVPTVRGRLAAWISASVALMLTYGGAIALEDFWHEQVFKRESVGWRFPDMVLPSLSWAWLGIVVAAAVLEVAWFRRERAAAPAA